MEDIYTWLECAGLNEKLFEDILQQSELRQRARYNEICSDILWEFFTNIETNVIDRTLLNSRGRPSSEPAKNIKSKQQHQNYQNLDITVDDIKRFLCTILIMGVRKYHSQIAYFDKNNLSLAPQGCGYICVRLSKRKFILLQLIGIFNHKNVFQVDDGKSGSFRLWFWEP